MRAAVGELGVHGREESGILSGQQVDEAAILPALCRLYTLQANTRSRRFHRRPAGEEGGNGHLNYKNEGNCNSEQNPYHGADRHMPWRAITWRRR